MSKKNALYREFYRLKKIENRSKKDIISILKIAESMYVTLLDEIKINEITEINTETIEKLAVQRLNEDPSDKDAIKMALEVWKFKHKIPNESSEVIDFSKMGGPIKIDSDPQ